MSENNIEFVKLNDKIKAEYLALEVFGFQQNFIETPLGSLKDMETKAWNIKWTIECIFSQGCMIGYAMHGMNKYKDVWLDRFMIDRRFQGKGYGTLALAKILPMLKKIYPDRRHILLSVEPGNNPAVSLYQKFGFYLTGAVEDNESVMQLRE